MISRSKNPDQSSSLCIESIDVVVIGTDINNTANHCWRGVDATPREKAPNQSSSLCIESIHVVVHRADVDCVPNHRR